MCVCLCVRWCVWVCVRVCMFAASMVGSNRLASEIGVIIGSYADGRVSAVLDSPGSQKHVVKQKPLSC